MVRKSCRAWAFALPLMALASPLPQASPELALPPCAAPALVQAIKSSGCDATNLPCICANPRLIPGLQAAIRTSCTQPGEFEQVASFAKNFCGAEAIASYTAANYPETLTAVEDLPTTTDYSTVVPPTQTGEPTFYTGPGATGIPAPTGEATTTGQAGEYIITDTMPLLPEETATVVMTGNGTEPSTTTMGLNGTMATTVPVVPKNGTADSGANEVVRSLGALVIGLGAVVFAEL